MEKIIFIVEDNNIYANALKVFLTSCFDDILIKTFPVGEECLKELYLNPNVIIMDYVLNTKNINAASGLTIIKMIQAVKPDTSFILMSAEIEFQVAAESLAKEGYSYLQKDASSFRKIESLMKEFFSSLTFQKNTNSLTE